MRERKINIIVVITLAIISAFLFYFTPYSFSVPKFILQLLPSSSHAPESELEELREENRVLTERLGKMDVLKKENNALKDQFHTATPNSTNLIPAQVIGSPQFIPGFSSIETLIIDQGLTSGVKKGLGVIVKNQLVGKISRVSQGLAVVQLLTTEGFTLTAKVISCSKCSERSSQALGVLKGKGAGEIILDNVVLSEKIEKGDIVMTKGDVSEEGIGIPPDLIVGKVVSIEKKSSELFQVARVKSLIDFTSLSTVFIIK